ncbi:zinc finger domain-containing protein [Streptomyces sp. NPDC001443]
MDRRETAALLAYIGRLDPRTIRTDPGELRDQLGQWHELLDDVPLATPHGWDARSVARGHIRVSPFQILPADIGRPWASYRRDRLGRHTDPTPAADPDDQATWTAELVGTRRSVAVGTAQPNQYRQLASASTDPRLEARLQEVGSCIPPDARAIFAQCWPARAAREAAIAQGLPNPLSVRCERCHAPVGARCRRQRFGRGGAVVGTVPRTTPHPSRASLAAARQAPESRQAPIA